MSSYICPIAKICKACCSAQKPHAYNKGSCVINKEPGCPKCVPVRKKKEKIDEAYKVISKRYRKSLKKLAQFEVSKNTLNMMDSSIKNLKKAKKINL